MCMCEYGKPHQDCYFYGRPIEPLAFSLRPSEVDPQAECPLYAVLPKEIRDMIFEYALTYEDACSYGSNHAFIQPHVAEENAEENKFKHTIACALLQSCKAVYLETYRLPILINGTIDPIAGWNRLPW